MLSNVNFKSDLKLPLKKMTRLYIQKYILELVIHSIVRSCSNKMMHYLWSLEPVYYNYSMYSILNIFKRSSNFNAKLNLAFLNCKLDFREKVQSFHCKKANWNALWATFLSDLNKLVCEVRCSDHCLFISTFARILKLLAQIASLFSIKYSVLQPIFLATIISWSPKRAQKQWKQRTKALRRHKSMASLRLLIQYIYIYIYIIYLQNPIRTSRKFQCKVQE